MKKLLLSSILIALAVSFASCEDDDKETVNSSTPDEALDTACEHMHECGDDSFSDVKECKNVFETQGKGPSSVPKACKSNYIAYFDCISNTSCSSDPSRCDSKVDKYNDCLVKHINDVDDTDDSGDNSASKGSNMTSIVSQYCSKVEACALESKQECTEEWLAFIPNACASKAAKFFKCSEKKSCNDIIDEESETCMSESESLYECIEEEKDNGENNGQNNGQNDISNDTLDDIYNKYCIHYDECFALAGEALYNKCYKNVRNTQSKCLSDHVALLKCETQLTCEQYIDSVSSPDAYCGDVREKFNSCNTIKSNTVDEAVTNLCQRDIRCGSNKSLTECKASLNESVPLEKLPEACYSQYISFLDCTSMVACTDSFDSCDPKANELKSCIQENTPHISSEDLDRIENAVNDACTHLVSCANANDEDWSKSECVSDFYTKNDYSALQPKCVSQVIAHLACLGSTSCDVLSEGEYCESELKAIKSCNQ